MTPSGTLEASAGMAADAPGMTIPPPSGLNGLPKQTPRHDYGRSDRRMTPSSLRLVATLALASACGLAALAIAAQPRDRALARAAQEKDKPEARESEGKKDSLRKKAQELPLKPDRTIEFAADEGTWVSLDISPDGKTIVF